MSRLKGGQCNTTFCAKIIQVYNLENAFDENDLPPLCPQVHPMEGSRLHSPRHPGHPDKPPAALPQPSDQAAAAVRAVTSWSSTSTPGYPVGIRWPPTICTQ